jgi:hypothetical protein
MYLKEATGWRSIRCGVRARWNESYPEVFEPFGGFSEATPVVDGHGQLPDVPGIGFEAKTNFFRVLCSIVSGGASVA